MAQRGPRKVFDGEFSCALTIDCRRTRRFFGCHVLDVTDRRSIPKIGVRQI